jgi:hypothetical protein
MLQHRVILCLLLCVSFASNAQEVLPKISVFQLGDKVIVSWKNDYQQSVEALTIQRSYDSLKNFTTIGSVLNPQNKENGYADAHPPYNRMYYRVFVTFEGGSYVITPSVKPVKDSLSRGSNPVVRYPWQLDARPIVRKPVVGTPIVSTPEPVFDLPPTNPSVPTKPEPAITFPSKWIYTAKDNNVVLHLPEANIKKYTAVFYDELERKVFELTNLKEEYLIIEKVNFVRSGWYNFELFDNGKLVEKNKFFVPKDGKASNEPARKNR